MQTHTLDERNNLMDWLMANQLTKDKKKIALMESWETVLLPFKGEFSGIIKGD